MGVGGWRWCRRVDLMSVHIAATLHMTSTLTHTLTLLHSGVGGWRQCARWGGGGKVGGVEGVGWCVGPLEGGGDVWCRRLEGCRCVGGCVGVGGCVWVLGVVKVGGV